VRCSEARVLRTPSHVNASFTAAIVARSLLAAERSSRGVGVRGVRRGDRLAVCWPVSVDVDVVVAADMKMVPVFGVREGAGAGAHARALGRECEKRLEDGCTKSVATAWGSGGETAPLAADSSLLLLDSSQAGPIRPCL
jgi:hypothetical protein